MRLVARVSAAAGGLALAAVAVSPPGTPSGPAGDAVQPPPAVVVAGEPAPSPTTTEAPVVVAPAPPPEPDAALPVATVESIIPAPRPELGLDDVVGVAVPRNDRTAAAAEPGGPDLLVIDRTVEGRPRVWLAVGERDGWVQVLVPLGRGALPSADPAAVNGRAVWVPAATVDLAPIDSRVVVDISDRQATITGADRRTVVVPVGVGREGVSDTPTGLGFLVDFFEDPHLGTVALTSMQSTTLDAFGGAPFALTAFHADPEHGRAVGQARSNGCLRLHDADFAAHLANLPLGTPVLLQP